MTAEQRTDMEKIEKKENILSFIENKNFSKTIWSPVGRAMHTYNMIEAGDRIAVGVSGGKDSLTTLNALVRIKKIANIDFDVGKENLSDYTDSGTEPADPPDV